MRYLIGIDDTDNLDTPGTGRLARSLAGVLAAQDSIEVEGITRHQLLVDPRLQYTSHNSSACLVVTSQPDRLDALLDTCRRFLATTSAPGSDAGLCVAEWSQVGEAVQQFGERAKRDILTQAEARTVAQREVLALEGLTGDHSGIIGALAAVGLRAAGNDGRFLWLAGLRELSGVYTADQLRRATPIELIQTIAGSDVPPADRIAVGDWVRPVLKQGRTVLLVEPEDQGESEWRVVAKDVVKQLSS